MRVADTRVFGITAMRECVQARQATADELHDQDTVLICNMLQDRLNELLMVNGEVVDIRPRQADESSYIQFTLGFVNGVLNMERWSDKISGGEYHGLYLPQAVEQLRTDLRNLTGVAA